MSIIRKGLLVLLFCIVFAWIYSKNLSLYRPDDSILILDKDNLIESLHNRSKPAIVVFYVGWCGHCQKFAPIFTAVAKEYRFHNISFATINCANEGAQHVCSLFGVDRFPTIKTVRSNVPVSTDNCDNVERYNGNKSINALRKLAQELIVSSTPNTNQYTINELNEAHLNKLYEENGTSLMFIVFGDNPTNMIAQKLIIDTSMCKNFSVYKVSDPNSEFYKTFNIQKSPLIIAVRFRGNFTVISPNDPLNTSKVRRDIYRHFSFLCPDAAALYSLSMMNDDLGNKIRNSSANLDVDEVAVSEISIDDLIGAVAYLLRNEIGAKTLDNITRPVAVDFIHVVSKCVPWSKEQREQLEKIITILNTTTTDVNVSTFSNLVNTSEMRNVFPVKPNWNNCKGSTEMFRGFPCSLWVLFHTMVTTCENKRSNILVDAITVLVMARKYIDHFFTCDYCRSHFLYLTSTVMDEVKNNEEALLYLWNKHNTVNSRLRFDESADPLHPKIQFPHNSTCPKCYNVTNLQPSDIFLATPGYSIPPIQWNKKEVLSFLRYYYSPENIRLTRSTITPYSIVELEEYNVDDYMDRNFIYYHMAPQLQLTQVCVVIFMVVVVLWMLVMQKLPIKIVRYISYFSKFKRDIKPVKHVV